MLFVFSSLTSGFQFECTLMSLRSQGLAPVVFAAVLSLSNEGLLFLFFLKIEFYFMCTSVLFAHMYMHCVHAQCQRKPEEGTKCCGTNVMDNGRPSCGCWELSLSSLREQQGLLTTKPSPQPLTISFLIILYFSVLQFPYFAAPTSLLSLFFIVSRESAEAFVW